MLLLLLPTWLHLRRALRPFLVCSEAMSGCGEQASPHVVIDVAIQAAGVRSLEGRPCKVPGTLLTAVTTPGSLERLPSGMAGGHSELEIRDQAGQGRGLRARGSRLSSEARRTAALRLVTASLA